MTKPILVWFRRDLRVADNPALHAAESSGAPVVPIYIRDDAAESDWPDGGASRWWLHHALVQMAASLRERGSRLILRQGDAATVLREVIKESGAASVHWNRRYEPALIARDTRLKAMLTEQGLEVRSHNAALLF
ncbi:MAG: deoxyribodipyrimidine photo-lyase, partial [Cephaloticoccus sp.]